MTRLSLLLLFLTVLIGCSAYDQTNYEILPGGSLLVTGPDGQLVAEPDLIGQTCRLRLRDGQTLEGQITSVSELDLTLSKKVTVSALEGPQTITTTVHKDDIKELTLKYFQPTRSSFLTAGLMIAAVPVGIVIAILFNRGIGLE